MKKQIIILFLSCFIGSNIIAQHRSASRETDKELFARAYVVPKEKIRDANKTYNRSEGSEPKLFSIEKLKNETKVTFLTPIYFDSQWLYFGRGYKIIDRDTGDEYLVRGYDDNIPFGELLIIKGFNNRCIFITLLFPPLKNKVKRIDIIEYVDETDIFPSNSNNEQTPIYNVDVSEYLVKQSKHPQIYK